MIMMNTRIFRTVLYSLCLIAIMLVAGSCSEPVGGMGKSPVYLTADGGSNWGMIIDVYDPTTIGGVTDEYFNITVKSNYKSSDLTTPYADVILQEYHVAYYRPDGKEPVPDPFMIQMQMTVPGGGSTSINTLVLRRDAKLRSPFKELVLGGGEGYIEFNAVVDFYGEDLMGNKLSARYVLSINASDM